MTTLERFATMLSISLIAAGMIGIHYHMGISPVVAFDLGAACTILTTNIENIKRDFLEIEAQWPLSLFAYISYSFMEV